jgi:murein DD-endopeptidase MepM/ murein hydrolase activator NlpD
MFMLLLAATAHGQSITEHIVVKGNTLYSISKTYGITVEALQEANPQISGTALSIGDTLLIPSTDNPAPTPEVQPSETTVPAPVDAGYEMYKVKKGDTPADLAKAWGFTTMRAFYRLNPDARTDWKKGMILVKPVLPGTFEESPKDSVAITTGSDSTVSVELLDEVHILGLLPFFHRDYINETPLAKRSPLALSFRQGMELAIDELNDSTRSIDITFADTYNHADSLRLAIERNPLDSFDLVVGPLYSKRVMEISKHASANKVISPLSKNPSINASPLQNAVVAEEYQWQAIIDLVAQRQEVAVLMANPRRTLIVAQSSAKTETAISGMFSVLNHPKVMKATEGWKENERLAFLDSTIHYDLIVYDNDPAFVLDVLRNLRAGNASYTWYTVEHQIVDNGITQDNFAREKGVVCAYSSYIDYRSEAAMSMVQSFREKFGAQPDGYAIKGYDVAQFYVRNLTEGTKAYRGVSLGFLPNEQGKNMYTELRVFQNLEWRKINP